MLETERLKILSEILLELHEVERAFDTVLRNADDAARRFTQVGQALLAKLEELRRQRNAMI